MQVATSILSSSKVNNVTFKNFSDYFKFDLCVDFSFWKSETGKCIPKEISHFPYCAFAPLCNRTESDCALMGRFENYCPNRDESCKSYGQEKPFFCSISKTCIPKGELIWRT